MTIALQALSVNASLGNTPILHDINASFLTGRWTSIVGPNGAGKSTLLKVLAGLLPIDGSIHLFAKSVLEWTGRERAQKMAWLGQGEVAPCDLTVFDVVMLGRLPHQAWLAGPSSEDHAMVEQSLRITQGWAWRDRAMGELSGGERQRVLLARLLAVDAAVYLMDEPLANLDPPHQADWLRLVRQLVAKGKTVITVLHEIQMALQADDLLVLADGRVMHSGTCTQTQTHQAVEAVFNGRIRIVHTPTPMVMLVP